MIADLLSTLDDADQEMIQLIYYERKSFQEAAKELGLNAKSYSWRKTKASVEKFAEALKQKPEIMELINEKYGLGEPDETDQTLS
jgi:DNA-directed RNA polymerase specialized sigma subunit